MKKVIVLLSIIAIVAFSACKKKSQYCVWQGNKGNQTIYVWEYNKPTDSQVKSVEDTCLCTITLVKECWPCKPQTDGNGNDIPCN